MTVLCKYFGRIGVLNIFSYFPGIVRVRKNLVRTNVGLEQDPSNSVAETRTSPWE